VARPRIVDALAGAGERLRERGVAQGTYLRQISRALRPLANPGARQAFLQTLRSVIDVRGQRVSADDRLYLLGHAPTPTLIVWGERDHTIPIEHGRAAHAAIPGSHFETLPEAAHFPHIEDAHGLADLLADFLATTEPAPIADAEWGDVIAARAPRERREELPSALGSGG
jgi:pimeloyl-ACP methyl ester carboxylesterase